MTFITYNGISSADFGLHIESKNIFSAPEYDISFQSIPGRSGDLIVSNNRFANVKVSYQKRYDGLVARFDKAKARHTEVTELIAERTARRHQIETYLQELWSRKPLTEFRDSDWLAMVDYITVHSKIDIRVTFKDGTEIKA